MFIPDYGTALIAGEVMFNCCASHNTEFTRWYLNCRTNYFVSKAPRTLRFAAGRNFHQLGRKILNLGQTETCACLVYGRAVRAANCRTTLQRRAGRVIRRLACPIILDDGACNARQMPQFLQAKNCRESRCHTLWLCVPPAVIYPSALVFRPRVFILPSGHTTRRKVAVLQFGLSTIA